MRTCRNCGAQLDDDARFCTACGTKVEDPGRVCPNCGAKVDDDAHFCTECGTKLDVSPAQPMESPVVENQVITPSEPVIKVEEKSWFSKNKAWVLPVGAVAILVPIIICAIMFLGSDKKGNGLLPVQKPAWEKFVVVLNDNVPVFKEANTLSPQLQIMDENLETDAVVQYFKWSDTADKRGFSSFNYVLSRNRILPVVSEEGDWYKVTVSEDYLQPVDCYIQKHYCREIKPEPITPELLQEMNTYKWRTAFYGLQTDDKFKNLCFISVLSEMEGEWLDVAVLYDGVLINPRTKRISIQANQNEDAEPLEISYDDGYPNLYYSQSMAENYTLDTRKIAQEAMNKSINLTYLFESIPTSQSYIQEVSYYFPEIDKFHLITFEQNVSGSQSSANIDDVEDQKEFTGFSFEVEQDDESMELYAVMDGEKRSTGISGAQVVILNQADYDDDGEREALVFEWGGGNSVEPPYIVYFDKESQEFKKASGFEDAMMFPEIMVENWEGKPSFRRDIGLRKDRYIYVNHEVKLAERIAPEVGTILSTITVDKVFGSSEEMEEKTIHIDIDIDGVKDEVVFYHDNSHVLDWGKKMLLKDMTGSYWCFPLGHEELGLVATKFAFVKPEEGEIPLVLCDDAWLYKWNGEKYLLQ